MIKTIWKCWIARRKLPELLFRYEKREETARELLPFMGALGLLKSVRVGDPVRNVGTALDLAAEFGVEVHRGTCYNDCRASLPKECWKSPISENADVWSYSSFLAVDRLDAEEISAWGPDPMEAICRCLVKARTAGVV